MTRVSDTDPPFAARAPQRLAYTLPEIASALGVSRDLVRDLITRHELPSFRLGRLRLVPAEAIEALLRRAYDEMKGPDPASPTRPAGEPPPGTRRRPSRRESDDGLT